MSSFSKNNILYHSLIVLGGLLLWLPSLKSSYFLSDDFVHLSDWGRSPLSDVLTWFYKEYGGLYRPLTALWWKFQFTLWGMNPTGYQATNVVLHGLCALVVRDIATQIDKERKYSSLVAAIIFFVLPGHIFGVLMISANTGLICSLLYLVSISAYLRRWSTLSLSSFIGALLAKELALSLPLLIATWDLIRRWQLPDPIRWNHWLYTVLPYVSINALYLLYRYLLFGHLPQNTMHDAFTLSRLVINATTYIVQIITPWGIEGFKPFFRTHPQLLLLCALLGIGSALILLWVLRRKLQVYHLLSLLWIGVAIMPAIRLYSPWNTYLAVVGIALLWGTCTTKRWRSWQHGLIILLLAISITYSIRQQQHWSHARSLSKEVVYGLLDHMRTDSNTVYVANLPAEWSGAPVIVGDWFLQKAMYLYGVSSQVLALSNVIQFQQHESIRIENKGSNLFTMQLTTAPSFFRIEQLEVLTHKTNPRSGYSYNIGKAHIRVLKQRGYGQPTYLSISMPDAESLEQIIVWDGSTFQPLEHKE